MTRLNLCLILIGLTAVLALVCYLLAQDIIRVNIRLFPPLVEITEGWHGASMGVVE